MNQIQKAHLSIILSGLLFGANYWIAKSIMPSFTPYEIVSFRILIVTIVFWIISSFIKTEKKINKKDILIIMLGGILGVTINQFFFFSGLMNSTPVETSILHSLSPLLVALFAIWLIKEKITKRKITGIIFGLIGAVILVLSEKSISFHDLHFKGNIFIIINISAYSLYLVIIKPIMNKYNVIQVLKYVFLGGLLSYAPIALLNIDSVSFSHIKTIEWLALTYVVVGTTLFTYLLTIFAIKRLPATTIGFYIYLQPFIASLIGYISGKEHLSLIKIIAALFLFTGIWLVIIGHRERKKL